MKGEEPQECALLNEADEFLRKKGGRYEIIAALMAGLRSSRASAVDRAETYLVMLKTTNLRGGGTTT